MTRAARPPAPPVGQLVRDRSTGRRLRVGDVDATQVIAEVADSADPGAVFRRVRTARIAVPAWSRRVEVQAEPDPVSHWRDQAGALHRITELDADTLGQAGAGALARDPGDEQYDRLGHGPRPGRVPAWIAARAVRLGLVEFGPPASDSQAGSGAADGRRWYRLTADGEYLLWVIREDVTRCRVCGCTEERACPGGCWWVPDPLLHGELCSACPPTP